MTLLDLLDTARADAVSASAAAPEPYLDDLVVVARATVTRHVPPPPPRRKLVPTVVAVDLTAPLRRATEGQAPVAFRITPRADHARPAWRRAEHHPFGDVPADAPLELRAFDGRLWAPVDDAGDDPVGVWLADATALAAAALPDEMQNPTGSRYWTAPDEADARRALHAWATAHLLIGDRLYAEAEEPMYWLSVTRTSVTLDLTSSERPGGLSPTSFRADQLDAALAAARRELRLAPDAPLVENARAAAEADVAHLSRYEQEDRTRYYYGPTHTVTVCRPDAIRCEFQPSRTMPLSAIARVEASITSTRGDLRPSGQAEGLVLPDGRRLMPRLAWTLIDERTGTTVERPLSDAEVAALGVTVTAGSHYNTASVRRNTPRR